MQGKKIVEIKNIFKSIKDKKFLIDIGTGDGRYPYYFALKNKDFIAIGIDPVKELMKKYSLKTTFKKIKGGADNLFYLIASIENLPLELNNLANIITIIFPWGSLLETIVKAYKQNLKNIIKIASKNCFLKAIFTYNNIYEYNEIKKRKLPELSLVYLKTLIPQYKEVGIEIINIDTFNNTENLKTVKSLWAKKIFIAKKREIFILNAIIKK